MVLSCKNISKSFGVNEIIKDITFHINEGEKAAIVGVNGAGKTTLFKIITGELEKDHGELVVSLGANMGYMSQTLDLVDHNTIEEEFLTIFEELIQLEEQMEILANEMTLLKGEALDKAIDKQSALSELFESKNGYEYKSRVRGVINGLGLKNMKDMVIRHLSGGQKTRVSLGKLLLKTPDLLLLDEPTNHLDIESIHWLEDYLKSYPKALLIISHDRYFLDKTVQKIIEIENRNSKVYQGNYTSFAKQKEVNRQIAFKHYADQQKIIKKQEESIKLLKSFNREKSIKRAESKEKLLNKLERVERPEQLPDKMRIDLTPRIKSGEDVLFASDLKKEFDDKLLFQNVDFKIYRGERAALIGPNGIGKTTLFKMICENMPYDNGIITLGHNVVIGYYDQHMDDITPGKTLFDEISDTYPKMKAGEIRNVLAAFVFTGDDVYKHTENLSGGERGRISLAKIMLSGANFLLLDEPTNHLDLYSKEILEEALKEFTGAVLFISHDRYFINSVATKILELNKTGITQTLGNYDYYLSKKAAFEKEEQQIHNEKEEGIINKKQWIKKKEEDSSFRKAKNKIKNLKADIAESEKRLDLIMLKLNEEEVFTNHEKAHHLYIEKEQTEEALLKLYEELEDLENEGNR